MQKMSDAVAGFSNELGNSQMNLGKFTMHLDNFFDIFGPFIFNIS